MFKKLWNYLTEVDYDTRQQIFGIRTLIIFGTAVLLMPLLIHYFSPVKEKSQKEKELDSLQMIYVHKLDSLNKISPQKYPKKKSYYASYEKEEEKEYEHTNTYRNYENDFSENKESIAPKYVAKEIVKFNLNTATKEDLVQVKGIGEVFAERIIKYRESIGGFNSKEQLYEVYGIDSNAVVNCQKHLVGTLNPSEQLKINSEEFKILLKHPYLEYKDVQLIFKNRPIASKESLCRIFPAKCEKLAPYIVFD